MSSAALEPFVNKMVSIITGDGRNIVGRLKGFDQTINVVIEESTERVYSPSEGVEQVSLPLPPPQPPPESSLWSAGPAGSLHPPRRQHRGDRGDRRGHRPQTRPRQHQGPAPRSDLGRIARRLPVISHSLFVHDFAYFCSRLFRLAIWLFRVDLLFPTVDSKE